MRAMPDETPGAHWGHQIQKVASLLKRGTHGAGAHAQAFKMTDGLADGDALGSLIKGSVSTDIILPSRLLIGLALCAEHVCKVSVLCPGRSRCYSAKEIRYVARA